jgi:hypothetical protein
MWTMKRVMKASTPTTPKTITWGLDNSTLRGECSNVLAYRFRMANRAAKRGSR